MLTDSRTSNGEHGSAMIAAIGIMLVAAFIIVAVMVSGIASRDNSRATLDRASTEQLAREAGTMLSTIYSAVDSGEFDNFVPRAAVLTRHATAAGGTLVANPAAIGPVDGSIPAAKRRSLCRVLDDGREGCWQLFAVKSPTWGETRAGAVTVYVRAWTRSAAAGISEPMMYRLDVRPTWMSDYQTIVDGKMAIGPGATIDGRMHSNGRDSSFFNMMSILPAQITVGYGGAATCTDLARLSTAVGTINTATSPSCSNNRFPNTNREINLLRAQSLARRLRFIQASVPTPNLQMISVDNQLASTNVTLSGNSVSVAGAGTISASTAGSNNGAVVLATGDVTVRGTLGRNARALVVAMSNDGVDNFTGGSAASVTITDTGPFGAAANAPGSSFGIVAQGDVIVPSRGGGGCSITARGAFTAMSGLLSIDRDVRIPLRVNTGSAYDCAGTATINGSISGHFAPILRSDANNAGFATRTLSFLPSLFNNPPPMYPTAFDWQVMKFAPANLDCFSDTGTLNKTPASGCVA